MSIRETLRVDYGDSFTTVVRNDWKIALLSAGAKLLTYEFDNLVEYCRQNNLKLLAEFYFYPFKGSEEVVELSIDVESKSTSEVEHLVLEHAFIQNAVLTTSDYQIVLVTTHDEMGIMLGRASAIKEITGCEVESLNYSFEEYTQEWRAGFKLAADSLLKLTAMYPSAFDKDMIVEVDFKSGSVFPQNDRPSHSINNLT